MAEAPRPAALEARFRDALERADVDGIVEATDVLQRAGDFGRSREWLEEAFAARPDSVRVANRLLELHLRYHNWARFDTVAETALGHHPASAELHFTVGRSHEAREDWVAAWVSFEEAIRRAPDELEPYLRAARAYRMARRVEEAVQVLQAGLKRHDDAAPLHAGLGYAWIQAGQPQKAVGCFERAVERQPDWTTYLDDLAGALILCERWADAARVASSSLDLRKRNERAWTAYAIAWNRLGDADRAEQGYRNALRAARDPTRAQGNYGLWLAGFPDRLLEAVRMLRAAADAHPGWTEVRRRLDRLLASTE